MSRDWTQEELQAASRAMKKSRNMGYEEFCDALDEVEATIVHFNLEGRTRKELVNAIETITGEKAVYQKMPTCAYTIGGITVDNTGNLIAKDKALAERIIRELATVGFTAEDFPTETFEEEPEEIDTLTIELPSESLSDGALANLDRIIEAKGNLIKKSIGTDSLAYTLTDEKISLPWFRADCTADEARAYMQFINALVNMARNAKRITAKEKEVENEKYAFRCFLLRLGMIGEGYKITRKILLRKLTGNSAWKNGKPK